MGSAFGLTHDQICQLIINPTTKKPISPTTLEVEFRGELDRGAPKAVLAVAGSLYNNAVKLNNVSAQIFYLKCRGKWTEQPLQVDTTIRHADDTYNQLILEIDRLAAAEGEGEGEASFARANGRTTH